MQPQMLLWCNTCSEDKALMAKPTAPSCNFQSSFGLAVFSSHVEKEKDKSMPLGIMQGDSVPRDRLQSHSMLQQCVMCLQSVSWQQKCLVAQEGTSTAQAEAARLQKQAAASAAAAQGRGQLLEQLQAAGAALADSHSSCHQLLRELNEARAAHKQAQQQLQGALCCRQQLPARTR